MRRVITSNYRKPQRLSRHHTAFLTWVVAYPLITGLLFILEPLVGGLILPLRTLLLTALMVPIMSYVALPAIMRAWLRHRPQAE